MGRYVNDNKVNLNAEGGSYDYDDAVREIAGLVNVGTRTDGKYYLADVLTSAKINKWAFYKPIRSSKKVNIDDTDRKTAKCGLTARSVTKLLTASIGAAAHTLSKDTCLAEVAEWAYNKPRGVKANEYEEWLRIRDMHLYNHIAVAPDADWEDIKVSKDVLQKIAAATVTKNAQPSGVTYTGYNYILQPKSNGSNFNSAYYNDFSIIFGKASGQEIGNTANMEIPLEYIASLDGDYRLALAVWIPNYLNGYGAWGFFISRMTIGYFYSSANTDKNKINIFPDLATNPYLASLMLERFDNTASSTNFDVVPILVKNLSTSQTSAGLFYPLIVTNVTAAYCMPSGQKAIKVVCDNTNYVWGKVDYEEIDGDKHAYIINTDPTNSHIFGYEIYIKLPNKKDLELDYTGSVTLAANARSTSLGDVPNERDYGIKVVIISQDGKAV